MRKLLTRLELSLFLPGACGSYHQCKRQLSLQIQPRRAMEKITKQASNVYSPCFGMLARTQKIKATARMQSKSCTSLLFANAMMVMLGCRRSYRPTAMGTRPGRCIVFSTGYRPAIQAPGSQVQGFSAAILAVRYSKNNGTCSGDATQCRGLSGSKWNAVNAKENEPGAAELYHNAKMIRTCTVSS